MASQPMQSDGVSSKRFSESQAEFYSMAGRTEYPRWTAESPTTTFSTASSTIIASPTSPTFNSLTNHDVTSAQEKLPTFNLTQIVIPQRQLSRQDKHEDTSGLGACQTNTSISPRRRDEDDHSHFYQQQRGFTTDIQLLGTSPEAKEWLKQKPTRSTTTRLIHQYNFQNYQQYQPQRNPLTSVNNSRIISSYPQAPVLLRANTNPSMVRGSEGSFEVRTLQPIPKQRPNSITSDAATATTIATTATPIGEKLECHQGSVDLQEHTTQRHFDGHFYNHGCDISSCHNNLTLQSCGKGPQVGHLVMSRSKINSSVGLPESENL
ncbi:hypothetical protein BGZ46_006141 [Entomortierella lignicola]|nr:hypothetical protein BGZ46_006141 [Entomortierella lignicola]